MEVIWTKPESFVVQTISIPTFMMIDHCGWTSRLLRKIKGERDKRKEPVLLLLTDLIELFSYFLEIRVLYLINSRLGYMYFVFFS